MSDLQSIESQIIQLVPGVTPIDVICELRGKMDYMKQESGRVSKMLDQAMIDYIKETGQEITIGTIRYYIGSPKTTSVRDGVKLMDVLLQLTHGELAKVVDCLVSQPFKHGTIKKLLEEHGRSEEFSELFEVVVKETLEEGKPKQSLMKSDDRFIR